MTNAEIDLEIARLNSLKTFEHKTGDGFPIKLGTVYYYLNYKNEFVEVVINHEWRIQEYKVVTENDDYNYRDLFVTKEAALLYEIRYSKACVEKAEKNLLKEQEKLKEFERLYEELPKHSALEQGN